VRDKVAVINSGFGFADAPQRPPRPNAVIAYLGTVDVAKMHPGFFDVIDELESRDIQVLVWGSPSDAVVTRARITRNPARIHLGGHISDPARALAKANIFFIHLSATTTMRQKTR
jgi:hypothetical protein